MRPFAVIDAETDPFIYGRTPAPFIWGFYDGDTYEQFTTTSDLARFLCAYDGIVYAHNGGRFDFHFLLPYLEPGSDVMLINGRIAKVALGACELRDSFCILPIPLGGYQKEKIDYAIFEQGEREKPHNKKRIEDYLYLDCKYLFELVSAFIERHGQKITQASAALTLAESMLDVKFPNSTAEYYDQFKPYYYGGRVQCFERGTRAEKFDVFDINSAYPWAMLKAHPFSLESYTGKGALDDAEKTPHAFFHLRGVSGGALPWREGIGKKLIYPADLCTRDYFVTGWEVIVGLETGTIKRDSCAVVSKTVHTETMAWENFIMPLYAERDDAKRTGDKSGNILAKLAMNSGYGKQGADPRNYTKDMLVDATLTPDLMCGGVYHKGRRFSYGGSPEGYDAEGPAGALVIATRCLDDTEQRFYNVACAASVTGCVRAHLWRSLRDVDGPIYCDTDSIACRDGSALETGGGLGAWKHEGEFSRWAIAGRKLYAFWTNAGDGRDFTARDLSERDAENLPLWGKIASKGAVLSSGELLALASGSLEKIEYQQPAPSFSIKFGPRHLKRDIRMMAG